VKLTTYYIAIIKTLEILYFVKQFPLSNMIKSYMQINFQIGVATQNMEYWMDPTISF